MLIYTSSRREGVLPSFTHFSSCLYFALFRFLSLFSALCGPKDIRLSAVKYSTVFSSQLVLSSGPVEVASSGFIRALPLKKMPAASGNYTTVVTGC